MDTKVVFLLFFLSSKFGNFTVAQAPRCYSTFDFQEKLLEKMVVLQHSVENMEKQLENKIVEMNAIAAKLKKDTIKLEASIKVDQIKMEDSIQEIGDNLQKEVNKKLGELDDSVEEMENKQREKLSMIEKFKEKMEEEYNRKLLSVDEAINQTESNADVLSNELHMQLNESLKQFEGRLYKPSVVFYAKDVTGQERYLSPGEMLVFSSTLFNTDNVYNTSSGLFTAPFSGNYWFSASVCNKDHYINLAIYVNNEEYSTPRVKPGDRCTSLSTIAVLQAGDHVHVVLKTGGALSSTSGWYIGALI